MSERLRESLPGLGPGGKSGGRKVDRQAGIIYDVLVVGRTSRNRRESKKGRRYTDDCLRDALRLYEGVKVRTHHKKAGKSSTTDIEGRDVGDTLGQLRGVRLTDAGIRANLHYLKSHPLAERLAEAAEGMPEAYGLSHDVSDWDGGLDGEGVYAITRIRKLEGVDLVDEPGSTRSLYESTTGGRAVLKRKKLSETLAGWSEPVKECWGKLLEDAGVSPDLPVADVADPNVAIADAFAQAVVAVVMGPGDRKGKLARIKAILDAQDKLIEAGDAEEADPPEDDGGGSATENDADSEVQESLQVARQDLEKARLREAVRGLCDAQQFIPNATDLKLLERLDTEAERKGYIRETAARRKPTVPAVVTEEQEVKDGATFAAALTRRK